MTTQKEQIRPISVGLEPFSDTPEKRLIAAFIVRAVEDFFIAKDLLNKITPETSNKFKNSIMDNYQEIYEFIFMPASEDTRFTLQWACSHIAKDSEGLIETIRKHCKSGKRRKFKLRRGYVVRYANKKEC